MVTMIQPGSRQGRVRIFKMTSWYTKSSVNEYVFFTPVFEEWDVGQVWNAIRDELHPDHDPDRMKQLLAAAAMVDPATLC